MPNRTATGGGPMDPRGGKKNRFDNEVNILVKYGMSRAKAEQAVQANAERALRQGWGMSPSKTVRSEGNLTGGGGRSAQAYKGGKTSQTSKKSMKKGK